MAVENVPPFDRLLGYGEGRLFSMAMENVPSSFHVPAIFKQTVLFIGYYLLLFIAPLVIMCATSTARVVVTLFIWGGGPFSMATENIPPPSMCLLPWIEISLICTTYIVTSKRRPICLF